MTNPSHPLVAANLKPYTVAVPEYRKVVECEVYDILFNGVRDPSLACFNQWAADSLAKNLNAAYQKGVETEHARRDAEDEAAHKLALETRRLETKLFPPTSPFAAITPDSGMTDELRAAMKTRLAYDTAKRELKAVESKLIAHLPRPCGEVELPGGPQPCVLGEPPIYLISEREPVFNGFSLWFHHTGWGLDEGSWHQLDEAAYVIARDHGHVYDQWSPEPPKSAPQS